MKTTIEISDGLLEAARRMAAERNTTLRAIVEAALCGYVAAGSCQAEARPRLRRHNFHGRGLQPGLSESEWAATREWSYKGRGG
jgi:hypothetical protein